jgi:hypothetical protein
MQNRWSGLLTMNPMAPSVVEAYKICVTESAEQHPQVVMRNGSRANIGGKVSNAARSWWPIQLMFVLAVAACTAPAIASPQSFTMHAQSVPEYRVISNSVCDDKTINAAASKVLRLVCQRAPITHSSTSPLIPLVVIGFVGGFVKPDDLRHPEPLFALYLRQHYGAGLYARVFSNHDEKGAESYVLQLLDTNHDGVVSIEERKTARIIIYGHSWGASETATFAKELERLRIPVLLTVQLDIISKPGQKPEVIPPNVAKAINFYQSNGPLHGRPMIVASDPRITRILGNIRMVYGHSYVNCNNYNWFARTFDRPHHEIENDAKVWDQVASLIDAEVHDFPAPAVARESEGLRGVVRQAETTTP